MNDQSKYSEQCIEQTQNWVEHFVVRHNFCPFAARPLKDRRIRYVGYPGEHQDEFIQQLADEILLLKEADPLIVETTIIIAPVILNDFLEYNQFLDVVDDILAELEVEGIIQVASFHPDYQFADLDSQDVRNFTNRSPYPMFHLIREDSIEMARQKMDTESIPDRNMEVLLDMGIEAVAKELNNIKEM